MQLLMCSNYSTNYAINKYNSAFYLLGTGVNTKYKPVINKTP